MEEKRLAVVEALGRWIAHEMKYAPQGKFARCAPPNATDLRALCRGVSLPLWDYVASRVRSERYVARAYGALFELLTVAPPKIAFSDLLSLPFCYIEPWIM